MRSLVFFTLAALIGGLTIWSGLAAGLSGRGAFDEHLVAIARSGLVIEADDLDGFMDGQHTTIEFDAGEAVAYMGANRSARDGITSTGVLYFLPAEVLTVFAETGVRITITASAVPEQPSREFWAALVTTEGYDSGWREFAIDPAGGSFSFELTDLPTVIDQPGFLRVWPDADGLTGIIAVTRVRLERL